MLALTLPGTAWAGVPVPLPAADLGQTNILDGEGGPGALLEVILLGSGADRLQDADGDRVPGRNRQRVYSFVLHPIYVADAQVAGAHPGIEVLVPVARVHNTFAAAGSGTDNGIGDVTIAPFLQWGPQKPHAGSVSLRAAVQAVAPTGSYRPSSPVNAGHGGWQLSPYVASTWRINQAWEMSGRLIYDRSGYVDGRSATGNPARMRAGDFLVLNACTSIAVTTVGSIGIGGYLLRQTAASRLDGVAVPASKQRVDAIGPVGRWQIGRSNLLLAAYAEFGAQNRPQGMSANLRFQQPF